MSLLAELGAVEIAASVISGKASCRQIVELCLDRVAKLEPHLNAFVSIDGNHARRRADELDGKLRAGHRLPLHGVPVGVKDIIDVAGMPTTCHSRIMPTDVALVNATAVDRLVRAGAVVIGKNSLHEFATGGPSFDLPWPPARNPWLRTHHPGGSSSGSAAAVAAGMVPVALGTDTAGSVRHPATACGVVGFKPSYDAVSRQGVFPLAFSLDHVGPLARSVADCAKVYEVLSGADPVSIDGATLAGLRIGVFEEFSSGAEGEIASAFGETLRLLQNAGCSLHTLSVPPLEAYSGCGRLVLQAEASAVHMDWLQEYGNGYGRRGFSRLSAGRTLSAAQYIRAQQLRRKLAEAMDQALASVDVAICASSLSLPCAIDDEAQLERTYDRQARTPFNLTGSPAIALPVGIAKSGLPIGVQLVARYGDDAKLLRTAHAAERVLGWQQKRPDFSDLLS
jgi:aspartyl-tRNA(Asn)/glutamyl-tRNA(Gln) amidotransferase subunit A